MDKKPELIVTRDGVPCEDQAAAIQEFKDRYGVHSDAHRQRMAEDALEAQYKGEPLSTSTEPWNWRPPLSTYVDNTNWCRDAQEKLKVSSDEEQPALFPEFDRDKHTISAHAAAAADMLELYVKRLRSGVCPEDLGREVTMVGQMMARQI